MRCCDLFWPGEVVIPAIRTIFSWTACPKSTAGRYLFISDPTLRSRQLRWIKSEIFASLAHHAWVESLARASQRGASLSVLSMHRHHDVTFVPPRMLVTIDAAALLGPLARVSRLVFEP